MNSPKVLDSDSLLQDMNSLQIRKNTLSSVSEPNLEIPRDTTERICHLCMEEFGTLKDLQNHIPTNHNLNHPTKYYNNSYPNSPSVVRFNNRTNTLRYDGNSRRESSHGFVSSFITFNIICIICFAITIGSILTFHLLAHYSNADDSTRRYHTKNFIYLNISRLLPNYTFEA